MRAVFILPIALLLLLPLVSADAIPPAASIDLAYNGSGIQGPIQAVALVCVGAGSEAYQDMDIIRQLDIREPDPEKNCTWRPWEFRGGCANSKCEMMSIPYSQPFKMAFYLPDLDKVFTTEETKAKLYRSRGDYLNKYYIDLASLSSKAANMESPSKEVAVTVIEKDEDGTLMMLFVAALLATLAVEALTALIFAKIAKIKRIKRLLLTVVGANLISLPVMWFILIPLFSVVVYYFFSATALYFLVILLAEACVIAFEAYFIHRMNKKSISPKQAIVLSIIMNVASVILGGFLAFLGLFSM